MTSDHGASRRDLLALAAGLAVLSGTANAQPAPPGGGGPVVVMLIHPGMILLDLAGPLTVFALLGADIHLTARDRAAVPTDIGIPVAPRDDFASAPAAPDVLFVPGGLGGSIAAMDDAATTAFLAQRGVQARFVTSVCTGALVLGAAGLLRGHRATTHWYVRDLLPLFGATPTAGRVVVDGNRVTAGGVTAGLDFGLTLAARLRGEAEARRVQLVLEYAPQPPFDAGEPEGAGPALVVDVLARRQPVLVAARQAAERARDRMAL